MRYFRNSGRRLMIVGCLVLASLPLLAQDFDLPVRNPFWPQGYNGKRYPISAEPRFRIERPKNPLSEAKVRTTEGEVATYEIGGEDPVTRDPVWTAAAKTLHFGSTLSFSNDTESQAAIEINGRVYTLGDLVSINFKGLRLTWRVESLSSDGKLKLKRLTYRKIGASK